MKLLLLHARCAKGAYKTVRHSATRVGQAWGLASATLIPPTPFPNNGRLAAMPPIMRFRQRPTCLCSTTHNFESNLCREFPHPALAVQLN